MKLYNDKETERIASGQRSLKLPPEIQDSAEEQLAMVVGATSLGDLKNPPSNRLEKLKGKQNTWSIRINSQWRIVFKWLDGHAEQIEITDYH